MEWLNNIKTQLPMDKIMQLKTVIFASLASKKEHPSLFEAKQIVKRINFLLAEKNTLSLKKQVIFQREIADNNGKKTIYTYIVDFSNPDEVTRLQNFLTELVDLTADDATNKKKEAISGFLDYIAQTTI